jgi:hypothetical protein
VRLPALRRSYPADPDEFRADQERRLVRAAVSDYCGKVLLRNFRRLMFAVALTVATIVGCIAEIHGHGLFELIWRVLS